MFSIPIIYFITTYGYVAILIGSFFEGEMILVLGGLAVQHGLLNLPLVFACSLFGTLTSDISFFLLGRYKGKVLIHKYKFFSKLHMVSEKMSGRKAPFLAFGLRFMYGFRHLVPFSLGMSSIPTRTFLLFNFLGGLTWVLSVGFVGYFFGDVLEIFLGHLRHYEFRVIVIVLVSVLVGRFLYKLLKYFLKKYMNRNQ
ncbi:MAG: DedA family protein [Patescibacteria group bacterium]